MVAVHLYQWETIIQVNGGLYRITSGNDGLPAVGLLNHPSGAQYVALNKRDALEILDTFASLVATACHEARGG